MKLQNNLWGMFQIIILTGVMLFLASCSKMAGFKDDYHVYKQNEIKEFIHNKTIKHGNELIYFKSNGSYFSLHPFGNTEYDIGKWYTKNKSIKAYDGSTFTLATLCMVSSKYQSKICRTLFKNGGKMYFDRFDVPHLKKYTGKQKIKNILLQEKFSISTLQAYQHLFGRDPDISNKIEKIKREIAREKAAAAKREREAQARRKAIRARYQKRDHSTYSTQGNYCSPDKECYRIIRQSSDRIYIRCQSYSTSEQIVWIDRKSGEYVSSITSPIAEHSHSFKKIANWLCGVY